MKKLLSTAIALTICVCSVSTEVYAQQRKSILDGQPSVRRRVLFLPKRFEVTPHLGATYLQDFKHSLLVGVRLEYHALEWLSFGVFFDYAVVNLDTGLTKEIVSTLPQTLNSNTLVDPSPSKEVMEDALDSLMFKAGVYVAYTPWFGKLSLFGKLFAKFDMHILAGAGFVMLKKGEFNPSNFSSDCSDRTKLCFNRVDDNGGLKIGPLFGFGLRFWALKWLAVSMTFHSIVIKRNSAGFDRTGDTDTVNTDSLVIDKNDESWENLMSFTVGVSFFFPMNAPRSK
jgi:outer membrane beta-barrel protein